MLGSTVFGLKSVQPEGVTPNWISVLALSPACWRFNPASIDQWRSDAERNCGHAGAAGLKAGGPNSRRVRPRLSQIARGGAA